MGKSGGDRLKVCMVCHPSQGGSGILATELGLALAARGHEVHFVSHERPFRLDLERENIAFHKVDVTKYPLFRYPPYSIALAGKLASLSEEIDFDILHVHYAMPHAISAYLCHQILHENSPPIVTTLHGTDVTLVGVEDEFREITSFVVNNSDAVTAVSKFLKRMAEMSFGVEREIRVIPNFVDSARHSPNLRAPEIRARYAVGDEMLIGHMSNFRPVKRLQDVVRTFAAVLKQVNARLLLIGEGELTQEVRRMAGELGIAEQVDFLGSVEQVGDILAQLDLFLLPSETESFGLAALEAMACGVPVIATRTGGLPEVIDHDVTGMLYPVGDYEAMGGAAISLLKDDERRRHMGDAARASAVERYSLDLIIPQYEELYWELVAARVRRI